MLHVSLHVSLHVHKCIAAQVHLQLVINVRKEISSKIVLNSFNV